jgi:diguanylate cyclase (GGDEF)-like protein
VHEKKLAEMLGEFTRTLATDFPIQGILDHLVERIVDVLPITGAGVTLIVDGKAPHYLAASDDDALRFEQLQSEIGEGPCLLAYRLGLPVAAPDLGGDIRFAKFAPPAVTAGLAAVFAFPLIHDKGTLGALDLYRDVPGALDDEAMAAAGTLAGVAVAYLLNAQNRDAARATSDQFRHSAMHDPLTGLPNRVLLRQRMEHAAQRAQRSHSVAAILFADLDRFKRVNDLYGHPVGDELLRAVAQRLAGLVRPGDTLCRYSGDEFVFLCEDLRSEADAEVLAGRIEAAFAQPFRLDQVDVDVAITASIGMAFAGPGDLISDQLVVQADAAMYQTKRSGGNAHRIIDLRQAAEVQDSELLETDLRSAVARGELDLAYQPIVRSADGLACGAEALLRWTHPVRGEISPLRIIAIAEQTELIIAVGTWVLERACRDFVGWLPARRAGEICLAVNVSARQLMGTGFAATVAAVLELTGMAPTSLVLEVTENVLIADSDRATTVLAELRALGIRIALDDFGTGYSSMRYLRELPIDIVKIDQCFIVDVDRPPTGGAIVSAVTDLAHTFGLTVVAEGVETESQRDAVQAIGCDQSQGYLFARPMSAAEFGAQFRAHPLHLPDTGAKV